MAVNYSIIDSIMLPGDKIGKSGLRVNYTYRTNFNDWVFNEGKGHEIEINEEGTVLTIKKFNPHFWILRSPIAQTKDEFATSWCNWKLKLENIEHAVELVNSAWKVFPYGDAKANYYIKGLVVSQFRNSSSKHPENFYMYPWDTGVTSGYFKTGGYGYNQWGYRRSGYFNVFNAGASAQNASNYFCGIGFYGVDNWIEGTAPESYVEARTANSVTYYEPNTDPIDVSDQPIIITLLPTGAEISSSPKVNFEVEAWDGYKNGSIIWHKDKTVENCLIKYDGSKISTGETVKSRWNVGTSVTDKNYFFLDDGVKRGNPSCAEATSECFNSKISWNNGYNGNNGDSAALLEIPINPPCHLPNPEEITNLNDYSPYELYLSGDGADDGNLKYLPWLNNFYASNKSPFIEDALDVTDPTIQAELKAEYDTQNTGGEHFCVKEIKNPFVDHLYLNNDATTPIKYPC